MRTVTSKDGTTIAFDQAGTGPALILIGGAFEQRAMDSETAQFMHVSAVALAKAMPNAQHRTLEGQTHEVAVQALAPVLVEFFNC